MKRRVGWERDARERSLRLEASYVGTFTKTTSEWLQNSPVIPLSSEMKWFWRYASASRVEPRV